MIPTIHIEASSNETELELLADIHKYYPIGMPHVDAGNSGYQRIKEIISEKINQLTNNNLPENCQALLKELSGYSAKQVINFLHYQFPNYHIVIKLLEQEDDHIKRWCWLNLEISLLTSHFLLYYKDNYAFKQYNKFENVPITTNIIVSQCVDADPEKAFFSFVAEQVKKHFPDHQYLQPKFAFSRFVSGGVPYGYEPSDKEKYPVYNFLFGNTFSYGDYQLATETSL